MEAFRISSGFRVFRNSDLCEIRDFLERFSQSVENLDIGYIRVTIQNVLRSDQVGITERKTGGGIIIDMHCHWRYVIDNLFGKVTRIFSHAATHIPERVDEKGEVYQCTADDSAYAILQTDSGVVCQFNSSWCVRVRRDELFTMQVDGTEGSATVGLRKCIVQSREDTPTPVWNPDVESPIDFFEDWKEARPEDEFENAFKSQWELFLKHVVAEEPFPWTLREGAKGVQLAELSLQSSREGRWMEVPES